MRLGVVILNYNDSDSTISLINKISEYRVIDDIVVVDNCSSDNSYSILSELKERRFHLLQSNANKGYSFGNNIGAKYLIEQCDSDIIFIANPDIIVEEYVFEAMSKVLEANPNIAFLGAVMHNSLNAPVKMWLKLPWYINSIFDCFFIGRQINKLIGKRYADYNDEIQFVDVVPGSFWAIKSSTLQNIGFLDENVFLFYEENILGVKARNSGLRVAILTSADYIHNHSVTIKKNISILNGYKINLASKLYFEETYRKIGKIRTAILKVMMKYGIAELKFLLKMRGALRYR
jgi:hypothetical protein